ncbi:purine-nucleoside phosphorylase [Breoghania corrubedonensis]|uniref:Purine nucleoside phosphorylase n=1 Tax=Breoghania corrubedonensis TaxID=665038 RepID=A0A2T5VFH9_9HYPH|nr:purine-nucleoside phosphorylase [Breoghania corrubedonensis]PTW62504.1 purine-nucleoside phosphorylase [Breoghania corrubedonensis]
MSGYGEQCAAIVRAARDAPYRVGIVLGSGLGTLADAVEDAARISYNELPGFPVSTVSSHASEIVAGRLAGQEVAILAGRAHYYESGDPTRMRTPLETLKALGCDIILLTNAAGSLDIDVMPGSQMLIADHINFSGFNPLIGEESDARFVDMSAAYDKDLRVRLKAVAAANDIPLTEGVYAWFSGPSFETPAEIRMARTLGADAVGMSTVPEVILARFLGLRVAAISTITNLASGMQAKLSHAETKKMGLEGVARLTTLVTGLLETLDKDKADA